MRGLKILLLVILIPVLLIGGLILAIPYLANGDAYGGKIVQQVEAAVGRKVTVGQIKLSVIPLAVRVDQLAACDNPPIGTSGHHTIEFFPRHMEPIGARQSKT